MQRAIELTDAQRHVLNAVLLKFDGRFDGMAVYGSRVQGRARDGSDIDLVIYGAASATDVEALRRSIEESDLSIHAGITVYDEICHAPLKSEIDRWAVPWRFDSNSAH
jgi:predicted nucleotidyltransferase